MATKEKPPEAEKDEAGEADAAPAPAKKGLGKIFAKVKIGKKMLLIGAPVLLLVLGGGGAAWFFLLRGAHDAKKTAVVAVPVPIVPPQVAFSDVPDILVNIQSSDGAPTYLKLSVSLELNSVEEKTGVAVVMPRVVDQFEAYLRELRVDDLKGSAGVLRLKEEMLRRVNVAAAPYKVRDVLLKQMIVQ